MMHAPKVIVALTTLCVLPGRSFSETIHDAARNNDLAAVRALPKKTPALVNQRDRYTFTALHYAARYGYGQMVDLLVSRGADVALRTRLEQTPLHLADAHGHPDVVKRLLAVGANRTPWTWPVIKGDYLGEPAPGFTPALFSPLLISSIYWDHGAPSFTSNRQEVYWSVVFDDDTGVLLNMKVVGGAWSQPMPVSFSQARYRDVSPIVSTDGKSLYFTSRDRTFLFSDAPRRTPALASRLRSERRPGDRPHTPGGSSPPIGA